MMGLLPISYLFWSLSFFGDKITSNWIYVIKSFFPLCVPVLKTFEVLFEDKWKLMLHAIIWPGFITDTETRAKRIVGSWRLNFQTLITAFPFIFIFGWKQYTHRISWPGTYIHTWVLVMIYIYDTIWSYTIHIIIYIITVWHGWTPFVIWGCDTAQ